jgi:two-component system cell cycle sensor histidine kinase/response regulator CckA
MSQRTIKNLLLVEDNPGDVRLLREMFKEEGSDHTEVTHVESVREAEEHLMGHAVDIILLDLDLPDAQGLGAVRRAHAAAPRVPLVVLTGFDDESLAVQALQEGAQDYLLKGQISTNGLRRALRYAIERKITEEALFEEKERAQVTLNCIGDAVACTDISGNITFLNPVAEKMMDWSSQEAAGRPMAEVFRVLDATSRETISSRMEMAVGQNGTVHLPPSCTLIRRDGGEVPIEDCVAPIHDREGHATGAVIVFRDVSAALDKTRQTQELIRALWESEARYSLVMEHTHDAIFLVDLEGRYTFGNRRLEQLTGYRREELIGEPFSIVLPPEGAEAALARRQALHSGRDHFFSYETEIVRKDGTRILAEVTSTNVMENGQLIAYLVVARDITGRKRNEVSLRESEERFRAMFEQAATGMGYNTLEGRWVRVNQRLCNIVGYTREELLARTFRDITHPDDLDGDLRARRQLVAGEIPSLAREKRYLHKDGSVVWIDLTVSMLREPSGPPKYFIAVVQDITARKQLEQELLHAQRMEGVGQLAGGIAHDFNNLLTVIGGRSHMALAKLQPADPLRRDLDLIKKTADRAAGLTRQLLAFSRKQVLQPRIVEPNDVVSNSTNLLKRLIGEDIELVFVPAGDLGRVRADPGQFEQVIVNLAVNARDAMPAGGQLTIETSNVELDASYAGRHVGLIPGPYVMLAVSDNGVGMDPATRARIFEPFFTTKGPGKGTGLGLATVYGIVKRSEGHIRVYSELGIGTVFKIYLPRTDAAPEAEPSGDTASLRGTETILLVEDEAEVRNLAREVLESLGYTLLEATDATEAVLIAERYVGLIDLLLTDVVMPRMGGGVLAEAVTAARPETKILFMSGYTDDAIVRHGVLEAGVQLLEKPFTLKTLAAKVRAVLDRQQ